LLAEASYHDTVTRFSLANPARVATMQALAADQLARRR